MMKLMAPAIDETPSSASAMIQNVTPSCGEYALLGERRVAEPAGVERAAEEEAAVERETAEQEAASS